MEYIEYETPSSLSGWGNCFFYVKNISPSLPDRPADAPIPAECWKEGVDEIDMPQI